MNYHLLQHYLGPVVVALYCAPAFAEPSAANAEPATVVIHNARVWTADPALPWADAVAVQGSKILAVGNWDELQKSVGSQTRVIDAQGGMVTPGWFDSHIHLLMGGGQLASVQLRDAKTPEEFTRRIGEFVKQTEPGTWITGMDWDHTLWGGELPTRDWIDAVTPNNPVFLLRLDGHMALANSAALRAAKIGDDVKDVPGGTIVRDNGGRPTGIFKDNAKGLVGRAIPEPTPRQQLAALDAAMDYLARNGVTSVHHMGGWDELAIFRKPTLRAACERASTPPCRSTRGSDSNAKSPPAAAATTGSASAISKA